MRRLSILLVGIILALAACSSSGSTEDTAVRLCDEVLRDLDRARIAVDEARPNTPEIDNAARAVADLEAEKSRSCDNDNESSATTSVPDNTEPSDCPDSWARSDSDKAGNRWLAEGVPAIREATTPHEARVAARQWLHKVRKDPGLLSGAARYLVNRTVNQDRLFDDEGCATQFAVDLVAEMETALALSQITPSEAPATGFNSGTQDGNVVGAANAGISGDRTAILIEFPDGTKVWIMARCGNPVVTGPPPVPQGPTDNPHRCPPEMPHGTWPVCKDDPTRDPADQGNVPPQVQGPAPWIPPGQGPTTPAAGDPPPVYTTPTTPTPTTVPRPTPTVPPNQGQPPDDPVPPDPPDGPPPCDPRVCGEMAMVVTSMPVGLQQMEFGLAT